MTDRTPSADVIAAIPANIRAELARTQTTEYQAAEHLGMSQPAFRRRQARPEMWEAVQLARLAALLDVPVRNLTGELGVSGERPTPDTGTTT